jgi:Mannosyltransferase (PIG-V)
MTPEPMPADGPGIHRAPSTNRPWRRSVAVIVGIWIAWSASMLAFQELVIARLQPDRPDHVLAWTAEETGVRRFGGRPYLAEPTLGTHVAFDSEYYLSIATVGYDDPEVIQMRAADGSETPLNFAFLPAYPMAVKVVAAPLAAIGLAPIAAAAVGGVVVSLLSALAAMLALFALARRHLGDAAGVRAAFYLLIFPSGLFLAQVYSEALFLALSFGVLALVADRRPLLAGLLAAVAVLTRPVGIALVIPIAIGLIEAVARRRWPVAEEAGEERPWVKIGAWVVAAVAPVATYLAWSFSPWGRTFEAVQREYFGRGLFNLEAAWPGWSSALAGLGEALPETRVYYGLEIAAVVLALVASVWALRRWPAASLFGLAVLVITLTSGEPQGMIRYVLAVPAVFLLLARLGEHPVFDRGWTVASVLLLALLAALYSFDFWVA